MLTIEQLELLRKNKMFSGFNLDELATLSASFEKIHYKNKQIIFKADQSGDNAYFIVSGKVEIFTYSKHKEKIILAELGVGEVFGELAMIDNKPRSATAQVSEESQVYSLSRHELLNFLDKKPAATIEMLRSMAARLTNTHDILNKNAAKNVNELLQKKLTLWERISMKAADYSGGLWFILLNLIIVVIWIVGNIYDIPFIPQFDPPPTFDSLQFAMGLMSLLICSLVLFSQRKSTISDRIRNDVEYAVNHKTEALIEKLQHEVKNIQKILVDKNIISAANSNPAK